MKNLILLACFLSILSSSCKRDPVASLDGWGPIKFGESFDSLAKDLGPPKSNEPMTDFRGVMLADWPLKHNEIAVSVRVAYSQSVGVYWIHPSLRKGLDVKALKGGFIEKYGTGYKVILVDEEGESWKWTSGEKEILAEWRVLELATGHGSMEMEPSYNPKYTDLKRQAAAEGTQTEAEAKEQTKQAL